MSVGLAVTVVSGLEILNIINNDLTTRLDLVNIVFVKVKRSQEHPDFFFAQLERCDFL